MQLLRFVDLVAGGELANLFMGKGGVGDINSSHERVLLNSINLGLIDLHTRFLLKREKRRFIPTQDEIMIEDPKFIELLSLHYGDKELLPVVDFIHTSPDTIILNHPENFLDTGVPMTVVYKAKPELLLDSDWENNSDIDLPESYINALCLFVASRLYASLNNHMDGDLNEGTRYMQRYLAEIEMLTNQGIDVDNLNDMWLFHQRGFI